MAATVAYHRGPRMQEAGALERREKSRERDAPSGRRRLGPGRSGATLKSALRGNSSIARPSSAHQGRAAARRLLPCTQVLYSSRVPTLLWKTFPQKGPVFPAFCLPRTFFSRFFPHAVNASGICCVVSGVGSPPRL